MVGNGEVDVKSGLGCGWVGMGGSKEVGIYEEGDRECEEGW